MTENPTPQSIQPVSPLGLPPTPPGQVQRPIRHKRSEGWNNIVSTIVVLLLAPLIAVLLTAFVFQSYQVDGPSMEPTLEHNNRLIVWKVPKTIARITGNPYIPNRGDVIIFVEHNIGSYGENPDKQLIKRVIGLPGERVVIKDGLVTIYNKQFPSGFQPDATLPYGEQGTIPTTPGELDTTVDKDHVFVLGDNRPNSLDSSEFGPIAATDIVGKLVMRVLPANKVKVF